MNDDDLRRLLDSSFGDGPEPPTPVDRLAPARRALRRRRLRSGGAGVAVVAVVVTAFAVVGSGSDPGSRASEPAVAPGGRTTGSATTAPQTPAAPTSSPAPARPENGTDVELAADGTLLLARGVTVTEKVADPLGSVLPHRSLGVAYTKAGEDYWAIAEYSPDGSYVSWDPAGKSFATLQQWLDQMVALDHDEPGLRLVAFGRGATETLRPRAGVEILDQTADVDLPGFAGPGDRSAAAMVDYEGQRWFVLARDLGGTPDYIPTAGSVGGRNLAEFLDYAATQYDSGEGLR